MSRKIFNPDDPIGDDVQYLNGRFELAPPEIRIRSDFNARFGYLTLEGNLQSGFPHALQAMADDLEPIAGSRNPSIQRMQMILERHGFDRLFNASQSLIDRVAVEPPAIDEDVRMLRHLSRFGRRVIVYSARNGLCHMFAKRPDEPFSPVVMDEWIRVLEENPLRDLNLRDPLTRLAQVPLHDGKAFEFYRQALVRLRDVYEQQMAELNRRNFEHIGLFRRGDKSTAERMSIASMQGLQCKMLSTADPDAYHVYLGSGS